MKLIFLFLLMLPFKIFSQDIDSLSTDSASVYIDTLSVVVDTAGVDTTGLISIEETVAEIDTLVPIYSVPVSDKSYFLNHEEFYWNDYRYAGNIADYLPASFLFDRGFIGYPSPVSLYGFSQGDLSILKDGILLNSRLEGSYDLNNLQSEYIDSVEASTLVRGFLYGQYMNPAAVNFITKDFLSIAPYSRIKYYEGAFGEAFIDGIFNLLLFDRFNLFIDVTNRKFDSSYTNTDFGIWQGTVKGKYLLSNNINIIGEYNIVDNQHGLNYGVDVDSILQTDNNLITTFYDELTAPVSSPNGRENIKQHNFSLRFLGKFYEGIGTDLTLYSRFDQHEVDYTTAARNKIKNKTYSNGVYLRQTASYSIFNFTLLTGFEKNDNTLLIDTANVYLDPIERNYRSFTISPILSANFFNEKLKPSIFFRYFSYDRTNYSHNRSGIGFDISYALNEMFGLYAGYSSVELFSDRRFDVVEGGVTYNSDFLEASVKAFKTTEFISPEFYLAYSDIRVKEYSGISLKFAFDFWKIILLEGNGSLFFNKKLESLFSIPEQTIKAGIFYNDILFGENLALKTGFTLDYASGIDHSIQNIYLFENSDSFMQVNFTIVGLIQNRARVYFTWENLFNENYFIVPYYPMRETNIRFGLAWELLN